MSDTTKKPGVRRREFLKVLGATSAAGAAACSEPTGKLIPYLVSPDQTVPGVSTYFATLCRECTASCGVVAETRDGRVIKLEGNPEHPTNRGALCARGQSAVQGLYNPDRFRGPMIKTGGAWKSATWDEATALLAQKLEEHKARAASAVFLNQHESGSFPSFLDSWLSAFGMRPHLSVDFEADHFAIEAHRRSYGAAWPTFDFSKAKLIVSFGADFLDGWGSSVANQLGFADARAKLADAPRFIYVGPRRSLTGLNADQWIACKPGGELAIVNYLQGRGDVNAAATASGVAAATLQGLRAEITAAKPSLLLAGARGENGLETALGVAALNRSAGNIGSTINTTSALLPFEGIAKQSDVLAAVERMRAGSVAIAFVRGPNPAYSLPPGARFAEAFAKVAFKVSFSLYPDETTELCDLILPDLHSLEHWGDSEPVRNTLAVQQPAMDPVFTGTRSTADVLIGIARRSPATAARFPQPDYRSWLIARLPGNTQQRAAMMARGLGEGSTLKREIPASSNTSSTSAAASPAAGELFLVTYPSPTLGDGRGANKPWLQELPDPVTKVLWSSWVELHPETAERLGIHRGDVLEVKTAAGSVRAPAITYLGIRPDTVAMALGQGHASTAQPTFYDGRDAALQWGYGRYARAVGVNVGSLLGASSTTPCTITKTDAHETIVSPEGSARQHDRGIAQAVAVADLGKPKEAPHHDIPGMPSHEFLPGLRSPVAADAQGELGAPTAADKGTQKGMYDPNHPTGMTKRRWAMTVDLARCTGCSACVTACYAENNIPTVGAPWQNGVVYAEKRPGFNITRGREMNWLRLERYYEGAEDGHFTEDFEARFVPMMCQHCGNAPCEPVCPVFATYHAPDGLNVQVYNRCVGTRYCSNNCPYKVRYFNWFGYGEPDRVQYAFPEPLNWQLNPDVTVRSKGVMEKCSFCVQRIREAENRAALDSREMAADEFTTACAAACPSRAITFGDAADENWSVAKNVADARAYHVFEELNTYTAVVYLKKVNHPTARGAAAGAS
jgi:anaerobic selenocysteine-containing dehydrogenase/Fe-S-cluster-containing dehydrogenase component